MPRFLFVAAESGGRPGFATFGRGKIPRPRSRPGRAGHFLAGTPNLFHSKDFARWQCAASDGACTSVAGSRPHGCVANSSHDEALYARSRCGLAPWHATSIHRRSGAPRGRRDAVLASSSTNRSRVQRWCRARVRTLGSTDGNGRGSLAPRDVGSVTTHYRTSARASFQMSLPVGVPIARRRTERHRRHHPPPLFMGLPRNTWPGVQDALRR